MTYSINKTDGTIIAVVADGTIDTTTSLQLPGKLFQNYGEPINENLIKLLENSASGTAPSAPLAGELWWDTTNQCLKVYNSSTNWHPMNVYVGATGTIRSGIDVGGRSKHRVRRCYESATSFCARFPA